MNELIRIQSKVTINVTPGLQGKDVTNPDAHIPDRLKVSPEWTRCTVLIKAGVGTYPAEIAEWNTVKALVKDEIITIGGFEDAKTEEQQKEVETFERKIDSVEGTKTKRKRASLEQLTEDK